MAFLRMRLPRYPVSKWTAVTAEGKRRDQAKHRNAFPSGSCFRSDVLVFNSLKGLSSPSWSVLFNQFYRFLEHGDCVGSSAAGAHWSPWHRIPFIPEYGIHTGAVLEQVLQFFVCPPVSLSFQFCFTCSDCVHSRNSNQEK